MSGKSDSADLPRRQEAETFVDRSQATLLPECEADVKAMRLFVRAWKAQMGIDDMRWRKPAYETGRVSGIYYEFRVPARWEASAFCYQARFMDIMSACNGIFGVYGAAPCKDWRRESFNLRGRR